MSNVVTIAKACKDEVRIRAINNTEMVQTARMTHDLAPTSCAALGRVLAMTSLMASDLENETGKVSITINGHGPCGTIVAEGNGKREVRGFVANPEVYLSREDGHLDVGRGVGIDGTLNVSKDLGMQNSTPFVGTVPLQTGEIGDDFAYYYALSEQVPSVVALGVLVDVDTTVACAGGILIQLMPFASEETIQCVEGILSKMKSVTEYLSSGKSMDDVILELFEDAVILDHMDMEWACHCSKDRFMNGLATLKNSDLEEIKREDHGATLKCEFCNHEYHVSEEEIDAILERKNACSK